MDQIGKQGRRTDEYGNPIGQQAGHGHQTGVTGVGAGGALAHGTGGTAQMMHSEQQGRRTDEYGSPMKDAYGNPVGQQGYGHETGVIGTGTGNDVLTGTGTGGGVTHGPGGTAQMTHPEQHQQKGGILHRSGSSSSSSSEDDGMGGRRKKGIKEKIKEKLPGHKKTDEFGQPIQGQGQAHTTTGATTGYGGTGTGTGATTGYGGTGAGAGAGAGAAGFREPEKKGMMDKIKEKLPGHQNK